MSARERWLAAGITVLVAVVLLLLFKGCRDARDNVRLDDGKKTLARDDTTRRTAIAATDTAAHRVDSTASSARSIDSAFQRGLARAKTRVDTILAEPVHDTTKIRELVHVVDTLRAEGAAEAQVCTDLANDCQAFRAQVMRERSATARELADTHEQLVIAERGRRRWGLGCAGGYGVARVPASGQVIAAPAVACGIAWRW
jgi:hypothetical protein